MRKWFIGIGFFVVSLLALFSLLLCTGIIRIYGFVSGYNNLSQEEQAHVAFSQGTLYNLSTTLEQMHQQGTVLCVNGWELRDEIAREGGKWLIYLFQEGCNSPTCLPLSSARRYAEEIGARPLFVAVDLRSGLFHYTEPILSIDFRYYDTIWCSSFQEKFLSDLIQSESEEYFNLVLFENGRLVKVFSTTEKRLVSSTTLNLQ